MSEELDVTHLEADTPEQALQVGVEELMRQLRAANLPHCSGAIIIALEDCTYEIEVTRYEREGGPKELDSTLN